MKTSQRNGEFNKVCVIGLGYVGLPIAATLADCNVNVIGVDISEKKIDDIKQNAGNKSPIRLEDLRLRDRNEIKQEKSNRSLTDKILEILNELRGV